MTSAQLPAQKIAEQIYLKNVELLQERRRTEQLLYSVSEIVIAIDGNYNISFFNHTAEKFLSVSDEDVLNKHIDEIVILQDENGNRISADNYCFQGDPSKSELEGVVLVTPLGATYVNVKTSVIEDPEIKTCVITMADVTKERMLDKLKDEFISITSHELRTPITIINSYLWMLDSGRAGELTGKQKEYLLKAIKGADRMLALINDTLNVARIEQGKITINIEQINIRKFLSEFDDDFKIKTEEKGLWLEQKISDDVCAVYADKSKLREVFLNFLGNSVKFTQKGGITIKGENYDDKFVKVSIIDTGQGIKTEDLDRLFNKFGRLDNNFTTVAGMGGTGLGLYITKSLIEKMGGQVGAESEGLGKGSTFWFTLPAVINSATICSLIN